MSEKQEEKPIEPEGAEKPRVHLPLAIGEKRPPLLKNLVTRRLGVHHGQHY